MAIYKGRNVSIMSGYIDDRRTPSKVEVPRPNSSRMTRLRLLAVAKISLVSDISTMNVMMDATTMFPDLWHPEAPDLKYDYSGPVKYYSRTERPPKYYYIDFGLSRKYDPKDGTPQELPILGGDKSVPEFQDEGYNKPSNPFCTDIYYLGNLMRTEFLRVSRKVRTIVSLSHPCACLGIPWLRFYA